MSVLIKGMEIPKDCIKCPLCLFVDGYWECLADGSHADFGGTCRPQNCPLIELPDAESERRMNDLISRQATLDAFDKNRQDLLSLRMDGAEHVLVHYGRPVIEDQPTIDAVPREDYEATIYAREQNAYDRGLLDGRKSAPWNVITKRPMTAEERTEWEEHIGAMLFDEEAFLYGNLPEYDKECLVYSKWGRIFIDTLQADEDCCCSWENDGDMESIIAWMPLPEPYKAERSEE